MANFNDSAAPNLGAMLLDICRPDGEYARLGVMLGSIENMRWRLIQATRAGYSAERIGGIAVEECAKIIATADAYRKEAGLPEPLERSWP